MSIGIYIYVCVYEILLVYVYICICMHMRMYIYSATTTTNKYIYIYKLPQVFNAQSSPESQSMLQMSEHKANGIRALLQVVRGTNLGCHSKCCQCFDKKQHLNAKQFISF